MISSRADSSVHFGTVFNTIFLDKLGARIGPKAICADYFPKIVATDLFDIILQDDRFLGDQQSSALRPIETKHVCWYGEIELVAIQVYEPVILLVYVVEYHEMILAGQV